MIALKLVQSSFNPNKHAVFFTRRPTNTNTSFVSLCKSKDSNSDSESSSPPPEGDARKQEMLARMAILQAQKIMENIDSQMQEFEESAEQNRMEIEKNDNELAEFEGQMEEDRNEGLFFKSLRQKKPVEKAKAKEEMKKIKEISKENAGSKTRRNIYLALIGLLVIAIADSFVSPSSDWRKVAVLGAILVPLVLQFLHEQGLVSETERTSKEKTEEEKK
ncbi:hypothetical protein JRO89_XS12G0059400 [Xanthoceras sorbifolium]|uniref:Uncharacterized protein n=1 Tax=Xanthoceras sorbifolium TaxID=99658 RepID=A0ABQ8HBE0_9ROSI|nr:hypothetical protein JRO89_XS12G0059400 [Xanthoceras sorbifolium]